MTPISVERQLIRSEVNRLAKRLSILPVFIVQGHALSIIVENQPDDRFYVWQGSADSPIQDVIDSVYSLNQLLNQTGDDIPKIASPSAIKDLITDLYACSNNYNKVASFAKVLMLAIAYDSATESQFGDVADLISDELGSLNNKLINLITHFGHQLT